MQVAADESAAQPSRAGRGKAREVQPDEVPMINPDDFSVHRPKEGVDSGRDLFGLSEPTRKPPPTPYPPPPPPGDARFVGPLAAAAADADAEAARHQLQIRGDLRAEEPPDRRDVEGDKVYNVRAGDVLFDKFVLRHVGYESLDIGFVGFPETESRRIGITPN